MNRRTDLKTEKKKQEDVACQFEDTIKRLLKTPPKPLKKSKVQK